METRNNQEYKLFHCSECGTIFKCLPHSVEGCIELYSTDFGDILPMANIPYCVWACPKCGQLLAGEPINCEDWVAEKVFSIKGDASTSKPLS